MKTGIRISLTAAFLAIAWAVPAGAEIKLRWDFTDKVTDAKSQGYAVAIDPNGDFYVVGTQLYSATGTDSYRACIEKVSSFRQFNEWTRTFNGSGASVYEDSYKAVAADPRGVGAVAGGTFWSAAKNGPQAMLAYYHSISTTFYALGTTAWFAQPDADSVEAVAVNGTSWIYAAGIRKGAAGNNTDIWISKYSFDGTRQIDYTYTDPVNVDDAALAIAVDDLTGFVYVAGYRTPYLPAAPGRLTKNIWVGKFDGDLGLVWEYEVDGPVSSTDFAASIALGDSGEIYLSGAVTQSGTFFQENLDVWIGRIDAPGGVPVLTWSYTLDGGERDSDTAWGITTDSSGIIWSTGSLDTPGSYWADLWLGKFSLAGVKIDSWKRDYSGNGDDIGRGITVSAMGPVIAGMQTDLVYRESLYLVQFREWFPSPAPTPDIINAYPNPFRPGSGGSYDGREIVIRALPAWSKVRIYTLSGIVVRELIDDNGDGKVSWDGRNASGKDAGSGVYIFAANAPGSGVKKGKVVIIR